MADTIKINRAPVLTLWGAVVANRLGFKWDEALTLGRAVAGPNAYSKGVSLGLFEPTPAAVREQRQEAEKKRLHVALLHRAVPVVKTTDGLRALSGTKPTSPESVQKYLDGKFGDDFERARKAMEKLARSMPPQKLAAAAYKLYEEFRPSVPAGVNGWGVTGKLDLDVIKKLART